MHLSRPTIRLIVACTLVVTTACADQKPADNTNPVVDTNCDDARSVVSRFGTRMRLVSVLAPDSIASQSIADAYGSLVSAPLLDAWQAKSSDAPGRETSNPWPARIEIRTMTADNEECVAEGDVVYVTSSDTMTAVDRRSVTLRLRDDGGWRITDYEERVSGTEANPDTSGSTDTMSSPADALRRHYANVRDTIVTITDTARLEGAAGSQYATIPVAVEVVRDGERQRLTGTYTLRRSMVDGATAEQRAWRIYSADLNAD